MKFRPRRYQCPRCRWDFAFRKKRCCPGCGTLLLIVSDVPTDAELTEIKSFWMWDPVREKWDYIHDWEEHKREAVIMDHHVRCPKESHIGFWIAGKPIVLLNRYACRDPEGFWLCTGRLEVVVLFGMLSLAAQFVYWSRIVSGLNQEHA